MSSNFASSLQFSATNPALSDPQIVTYLRQSRQWSTILAQAQRVQLILQTCKALDISISEADLQAYGDEFRWNAKLLTSDQTHQWLSQQSISLEDWVDGLKIDYLTQALKEHLFGEQTDTHYLSNRDRYRRVALSQIMVADRGTAQTLCRQLQSHPERFCQLALQQSQSHSVNKTGGYAGIHYCAELPPTLQQAIVDQPEGTILEPILTDRRYVVVKIEAWIPTVLDVSLRQEILDILFEDWLTKQDEGTQ